jgi:hypothetical protein
MGERHPPALALQLGGERCHVLTDRRCIWARLNEYTID